MSPRPGAASPGADPALRAVLFDATGTLIELAEPVGETYARFAAAFGAPLPAWRLEDAFRRVLPGMPPRVFPGLGPGEAAAAERVWWREAVRQCFRAADASVAPGDFEACFDALYRHYARASAWRARPGALASLDALRAAGLRVGVVSNFDLRLAPVLARLGFAGRLDALLVPALAGCAKPDPAFFARALAALGVAAHSAAYVGDDVAGDAGGALAAGLARAVDVAGWATLRPLVARLGVGGNPPPMENR